MTDDDRRLSELRAIAETNAALEALAAGIVVVTTSGEIVRMNREAMDLLGLDDAGPRRVHELLEQLAVERPDGSRVRMRETPFARARNGEAVRDVILRLVPRGRPRRWVQVSAVPLREAGAVHHVVVSVVDVTRTRDLEQDQRDLVRGLLDQLAALRTVRERAQRIADGARTVEEASALAREISAAARRAEAAVRELESAVRDDARALEAAPERVDVRASLFDVLERLAAAEVDVGRVVLSAPPGLARAHVDPDHLEAILVELVRGALAGAGAGTSVRVACESDDATVRITVSSTGEDIAPEDLHRTFDRLFSARGRPAGRLYTVRLLAEANRGRVYAAGGEGGSLAIHVDLPSRRP